MDTYEAHRRVLAGERIGVVVTNAFDGLASAIEIDEEGWQRRLERNPNATNYVLLILK